MTNSIYKTRTNYISVTDEDEFRRIMALCITSDGERPEVITRTDEDGKTHFGFYVEDDIEGYMLDENNNIVDPYSKDFDDEMDYETSYDRFIEDLQKVIAPDDALIITIIAYEKMRWLASQSIIVTHNDVKHMDMSDLAFKTARKMLDNPDWHTEMYY